MNPQNLNPKPQLDHHRVDDRALVLHGLEVVVEHCLSDDVQRLRLRVEG